MRDETTIIENDYIARGAKYVRATVLMGMDPMSMDVAVVTPGWPSRSSINPSSHVRSTVLVSIYPMSEFVTSVFLSPYVGEIEVGP